MGEKGRRLFSRMKRATQKQTWKKQKHKPAGNRHLEDKEVLHLKPEKKLKTQKGTEQRIPQISKEKEVSRQEEKLHCQRFSLLDQVLGRRSWRKRSNTKNENPKEVNLKALLIKNQREGQ